MPETEHDASQHQDAQATCACRERIDVLPYPLESVLPGLPSLSFVASGAERGDVKEGQGKAGGKADKAHTQHGNKDEQVRTGHPHLDLEQTKSDKAGEEVSEGFQARVCQITTSASSTASHQEEHPPFCFDDYLVPTEQDEPGPDHNSSQLSATHHDDDQMHDFYEPRFCIPPLSAPAFPDTFKPQGTPAPSLRRRSRHPATPHAPCINPALVTGPTIRTSPVREFYMLDPSTRLYERYREVGDVIYRAVYTSERSAEEGRCDSAQSYPYGMGVKVAEPSRSTQWQGGDQAPASQVPWYGASGSMNERRWIVPGVHEVPGAFRTRPAPRLDPRTNRTILGPSGLLDATAADAQPRFTIRFVKPFATNLQSYTGHTGPDAGFVYAGSSSRESATCAGKPQQQSSRPLFQIEGAMPHSRPFRNLHDIHSSQSLPAMFYPHESPPSIRPPLKRRHMREAGGGGMQGSSNILPFAGLGSSYLKKPAVPYFAQTRDSADHFTPGVTYRKQIPIPNLAGLSAPVASTSLVAGWRMPATQGPATSHINIMASSSMQQPASTLSTPHNKPFLATMQQPMHDAPRRMSRDHWVSAEAARFSQLLLLPPSVPTLRSISIALQDSQNRPGSMASTAHTVVPPCDTPTLRPKLINTTSQKRQLLKEKQALPQSPGTTPPLCLRLDNQPIAKRVKVKRAASTVREVADSRRVNVEPEQNTARAPAHSLIESPADSRVSPTPKRARRKSSLLRPRPLARSAETTPTSAVASQPPLVAPSMTAQQIQGWSQLVAANAEAPVPGGLADVFGSAIGGAFDVPSPGLPQQITALRSHKKLRPSKLRTISISTIESLPGPPLDGQRRTRRTVPQVASRPNQI